jgi:hypothetical protein
MIPGYGLVSVMACAITYLLPWKALSPVCVQSMKIVKGVSVAKGATPVSI